MKVRPPLAAAAFALWLAGCQTTDESNWVVTGAATPFDRAEETCETQQDFIQEEGAKPAFFVKCMDALGWEPKAGTRWATVEEPPEPG